MIERLDLKIISFFIFLLGITFIIHAFVTKDLSILVSAGVMFVLFVYIFIASKDVVILYKRNGYEKE